jgi:NitT/TauT family transport system substrate-binding protein
MTRLRRAAFLAASAALAATPRLTRAQTAPAVRIGATLADNYAEAYFANELGLFAKAGLTVDVQTLASGAAIASAVAGGAIDIGIATPVSLAGAVSRGVPFVYVCAAAITNERVPSGLVCVPRTSPLRGPKDLAGKTVGVPSLGSSGDLALRLWLFQAGVDPAKARIVETPFGTMGPGVESGRFDAAEISEPALTAALGANNLRSVGDPFLSFGPEMLVAGWFATTAFVQKNAELVRRVAAVLIEAGRWSNAHHDESAVILARLTGIDVAVIRRMARSIFVDELRVGQIQSQLDAALKFGFITRAVGAAELIAR